MRLPAARLALGLVVFVLVGWVAGALVTSLVGSSGFWAMFVARCMREASVK